MRQRGHIFKVAPTPLRESPRYKCKGCGLRRRRVVAVSSATFGFTRSFWLYREAKGVTWSTYLPVCPRLAAAEDAE